MTTAVDVENAREYLVTAGVIPSDQAAEVEPLGGGVSNTVLRVETATECLVLKQPLPNLAVEADWPADPQRVHNEAAAARAYRDVIQAADLAAFQVPAVVHEDETNHVIAISCAPDAATTWKTELLAGDVDGAVAGTLGDFLGASHRRTAGEESLRSVFEHERPFEQLRVDPYHRTVATRHPDVADRIHAEVERLAESSRCLVHGDYSPKNVLVDRSESPQTVWLLDFEVAHWGDPAFDAAFMLNHLLIKAVYRSDRQPRYLEAARRFWNRYDAAVPWSIESETVRELAILMLARVDGKSPVEYVTAAATKDVLRTIAKRALQDDVETLNELTTVLEEVSDA